MKYLVMEVHPAYAIVLDEAGRFCKAANLHYQVGDTVQTIVELRQPRAAAPILWKPLAGLAAAAACFCLVFFGYYQPNFTAYGTLRIRINPDVEMTVSRTDRVLDLEGLNEDGRALIDGYVYRGKDQETATGELVERAIHMGYLSDGDTVSIAVSSSDADWQAREEAKIQAGLEERYGETIVIQLGTGAVSAGPPPSSDTPEVVIPVTPPSPADDGIGSSVDDGDTDYGPDADGVTDYEDTDYDPGGDGITDYRPDDGSYTDGVTDYEDREDRDDRDDRDTDDGDDHDEDNDDDDDDDNDDDDDDAGDD